VDALLAAVDCLRETVLAMKDGGGHDDRHIAASQARLQNLLPGQSRIEVFQAPVCEPTDEPESKDVEIGATWRIGFRRFPHLFKTGNDPLRLLRALAGAGTLAVSADISRLPAFGDLDPECCYLGWDLTLDTDIGRAAIGEVFEWVEGDCDLVITRSSEGLISEPVPPQVPEADCNENDAHTPGRAHIESPRSGSERRQPVSPGAEQSSIRVSIQKIDALINLVGELVITQSMLSQCGQDLSSQNLGRLRDGLAQLARNTRELQESVLGIRMVPISFSFNRFPRLVRDLGHKLRKNVELRVSGENTELDKTVMEKISDPLVHLIRNASFRSAEPWRRVKTGWDSLKAQALALRPGNSFERHTAILVDLQDLMAHVADTSGLILDSERESAHLVDIAVFRLPIVGERLGVLRGKAAGFAAKGSLTSEQKAELIGGLAVVRDALDAIDERLRLDREWYRGRRPDRRRPGRVGRQVPELHRVGGREGDPGARRSAHRGQAGAGLRRRERGHRGRVPAGRYRIGVSGSSPAAAGRAPGT